MLCPKDLTSTLQTCFKFGGIFIACKEQFPVIYIISEMGGQPVKKILVNARGVSTQKVEVKSPHIRTNISINREGVTAFAVAR